MSASSLVVDPEQLRMLVERVKAGALQEGDTELLVGCIETVRDLHRHLSEQKMTIRRLQRWLFGAKTEKSKTAAPGKTASTINRAKRTKGSCPKQRQGRGRLAWRDYRAAKTCFIPHETQTKGAPCSACGRGRFFNLEPSRQIHLVGQAPILATGP